MADADCHKDPRRLVAVLLDEASFGRGNPDQEHERAAAVWDILEGNHFAVLGHNGGPYTLRISLVERKLMLEVSLESGEPVIVILLSLSPLRRVIKDYDIICNSYYAAICTASPSQIEAVDMGRRGVHDEASEILCERLSGKIEVDFVTARRLFTLIFALHWKG